VFGIGLAVCLGNPAREGLDDFEAFLRCGKNAIGRCCGFFGNSLDAILYGRGGAGDGIG
jgi:hypothetical protein